MTYRTIPLVRRPHKNAGGRSEHGWCAICGLAIKTPPKYRVHIGGGGSVLVHGDDSAAFSADRAEQPGDLGCHPIGPECRKGIPKEYVFLD